MNRVVKFANDIFWYLVLGTVIGTLAGLLRFNLI